MENLDVYWVVKLNEFHFIRYNKKATADSFYLFAKEQGKSPSLMKVIVYEPESIQTQKERIERETSRPKRASKTGKHGHKPRVQKVTRQGKAAHKKSGKGKGER